MSLNTPPTSAGDASASAGRLTLMERLQIRLLTPGRHWVLVSVALYIIACALPALGPINSDRMIRGYVCLIAIRDPVVHIYKLPYWWANPTYFVAVIAALFNLRRMALIFSVAAVLLAISYEIGAFCDGGFAGVRDVLLPGCVAWIASLQLLACHELWRQWLEWQRRKNRLEVGHNETANASPVEGR